MSTSLPTSARLPARNGSTTTILIIVAGLAALLVTGMPALADPVLDDAFAEAPPVQPETAPQPSQAEATPAEKTENAAQKPTEPKWISLFNGKDLKGWKPTEFGGEGDVKVEEGKLILESGNDMTGVTIDREIPKINYLVELEAMRVDGSDFFCGLTFPVKDKPCSLICGGWGGGLCGLSSLNGLDASENSTTSYQEFKNGKWYKVRLRVTDKWIEAWIDGDGKLTEDDQIVDQNLTDLEVGIRPEVELSRPFGIATWRTTGALRNIRIRPLTKKEIEEVAAKPVDF